MKGCRIQVRCEQRSVAKQVRESAPDDFSDDDRKRLEEVARLAGELAPSVGKGEVLVSVQVIEGIQGGEGFAAPSVMVSVQLLSDQVKAQLEAMGNALS